MPKGNPMYCRISSAVRLGAGTRAEVSAGTAENSQYLEPAAGRSHQLECMLAQLVGLVGFQAVDELMKIAVIVRCGHTSRLRHRGGTAGVRDRIVLGRISDGARSSIARSGQKYDARRCGRTPASAGLSGRRAAAWVVGLLACGHVPEQVGGGGRGEGGGSEQGEGAGVAGGVWRGVQG